MSQFRSSIRNFPHKISLQIGDGDSVRAWKNVSSEYSSVYQEFPRTTVSAILPAKNEEFIYNLKSPLDLKTNYRLNYVRHPKATRHKVKVPDLPHLGSDDVLATNKSTYCEAYLPKTTTIPAPCPPDPLENKVLEQGTDFEAKNTHHRTEFRKYSLPECQTSKAKSHTGLGERLILNTPIDIQPCYSTTTSSTYKNPQSSVKLIPIVHYQEIQPSESIMKLESTQRADYTGKKIEESVNTLDLPHPDKRNWAVFEKEPPDRNKNQLATTSSDDFKAYERKLHRPKSCKPVGQILFPTDPFQQQSVYKEDFVKLPSEIWPGKVKRPRNNLKFEAEREEGERVPKISSHYDDSFHDKLPKGTPKTSMIIPRLAEVFPLPFAKIPSDTSYGVTYRKFTAEEIRNARNVLRKAEYLASKDKFPLLLNASSGRAEKIEDNTTNKDHFKWYYVPPRTLIKPVVQEKVDFAFPLEPK